MGNGLSSPFMTTVALHSIVICISRQSKRQGKLSRLHHLQVHNTTAQPCSCPSVAAMTCRMPAQACREMCYNWHA